MILNIVILLQSIYIASAIGLNLIPVSSSIDSGNNFTSLPLDSLDYRQVHSVSNSPITDIKLISDYQLLSVTDAGIVQLTNILTNESILLASFNFACGKWRLQPLTTKLFLVISPDPGNIFCLNTEGLTLWNKQYETIGSVLTTSSNSIIISSTADPDSWDSKAQIHVLSVDGAEQAQINLDFPKFVSLAEIDDSILFWNTFYGPFVLDPKQDFEYTKWNINWNSGISNPSIDRYGKLIGYTDSYRTIVLLEKGEHDPACYSTSEYFNGIILERELGSSIISDGDNIIALYPSKVLILQEDSVNLWDTFSLKEDIGFLKDLIVNMTTNTYLILATKGVYLGPEQKQIFYFNDRLTTNYIIDRMNSRVIAGTELGNIILLNLS
jgi:hypothetical protein